MRHNNYQNMIQSNNSSHVLSYIFNSIINNKDVSKYITDIKNYDKKLYNHSINVTLLSILIGNSIYDDRRELSELAIAALLHDYGKIFISKSILNKPENLTYRERKIIEQHSILGYIKLKQNSVFNDNILDGILDHHERINGSGYNIGKRENDISPYGKIIMIADVYDAMVTDRVYRKHIDSGIVKDYIKSKAGVYFDLYCTDIFLKCINSYDTAVAKGNVYEKANLCKT